MLNLTHPTPDTHAGRVLAALEAAGQRGVTSEQLADHLGETPGRVRAAIASLRHTFGVDILCLRGRYRVVPVEPEPRADRHEDLLALLRAARRLHLRDVARVSGRRTPDVVSAIRALRLRDGVPVELTTRGYVVLHERLRAEPAELVALLRQRGPLLTRAAAALLHVSPALLGRLVAELQARGLPVHLRGDALSLAA
jgi:biotin operon repressor